MKNGKQAESFVASTESFNTTVYGSYLSIIGHYKGYCNHGVIVRVKGVGGGDIPNPTTLEYLKETYTQMCKTYKEYTFKKV